MTVNNTTLKAAGSVLNINPTFQDVPVIDERGPIANPKSEQQLTGATIGLNVPKEFSKNENAKNLFKEIGKGVKKNVVQEGMQKAIEYGFDITINAKGANVVTMLFNFQEVGKGSSLTEQQQARVKEERTLAMNAVINYYLNFSQQKEEIKDENGK